jgi:cell wall-associated NlpC family hydrolase
MPAIIDRDLYLASDGPQRHIVAEAFFWQKTPYGYGHKDAEAADGAHGTAPTGRSIDCSGFVVAVHQRVFPGADLKRERDNVAAIAISPLWRDVTTPQAGDIVLWDGHVGIVVDPAAQKFIGSQTSTGVAIARYGTGYWKNRGVTGFRRWATLP